MLIIYVVIEVMFTSKMFAHSFLIFILTKKMNLAPFFYDSKYILIFVIKNRHIEVNNFIFYF